MVADMLGYLDDQRVQPSLIDLAWDLERIADQDIVMTSMGNASRAVITPYYPALPMEHTVFDRLDWAAVYGRPLSEAVIRVHRDNKAVTAANVVVRHCAVPAVGEVNKVCQAAAQFPTDPDREYGTMERVIDEVIRQRALGESIESATGTIYVAERKRRGDAGKWATSLTYSTDDVVALK
jgi:hypothetical protein